MFLFFFFQTSLSKAICIFRHSHASQINVTTLLGLLTRYTAGIRYALELQSLQRGMSESGQTEDDDTNHSVSSIEEDFVTAFEHLEEEENGECSCRSFEKCVTLACVTCFVLRPVYIYIFVILCALNMFMHTKQQNVTFIQNTFQM